MKANLIVCKANLAYSAFACLFEKTNLLNFRVAKTAFQANKTVWFSHTGLPSLVRSK
jgi:hypothetical protein